MTDQATARANLAILSIATMLNRSAVPMIVLVGGLLGLALAPDPSLATLPIAATVVGLGACAYPAASIMSRVGRRTGFALASFVSGLGATAAALSIMAESFTGLCLASTVMGASQAFVQQYRFAATENVSAPRVGQAISLLLLVGLVSAIAGPEIGRLGRDWVEGAPFAGAFLGLAVMHFLAAGLLASYREVRVERRRSESAARPLARIMVQPSYIVAAAAAAFAYGVMSIMMTAAPISMHETYGYGLDVTAWAIEAHVLAMYMPSLVTGMLIMRFGVHAIMSAGLAILGLSVATAWVGESPAHFTLALILLGVGWNLLFTAGSSLITTAYRESERFKAQGLNDAFVFGTSAVMTLAAGALLELVGWRGLLLCNVPFLAAMLALMILLPRRNDAAREADQAP